MKYRSASVAGAPKAGVSPGVYSALRLSSSVFLVDGELEIDLLVL